MVVFNEWFPIEKESILAIAERRKTAEAQLYPIQSIYVVQRSDKQDNFAENQQDSSTSKKFEENMSDGLKIVDQLEFDNYFVHPTLSVRSFDQAEIEIAEHESCISLEKSVGQLSIKESGLIFGEKEMKLSKKLDEATHQKSQFTMSSGNKKKSLLTTASEEKALSSKLSQKGAISFVVRSTRKFVYKTKLIGREDSERCKRQAQENSN